MKPAITKPAFGSPDEIDARLAAAEEVGLITLKPISANLGVEVERLDLKQTLSPEQIATVYDALIRHKVLVFKKIGLNHEQQVRFTHELSKASPNIGAPTIGHTVFGHVDEYPEIFSVYQGESSKPRNMERYEATAAADSWTGYHCDITACVNPPSIGMLRGEIIPKGVGDTNFGNLAVAYETLDESTKQQLESLVAEHEYKFGKTKGSEAGDSIASRRMVSHHPLVVVHPDTGEKILFNSPGFLKFVVGMTSEDSKALLHKIWKHSVEFTIQHVWDQGDLVVWDERSTTHRAPTDIYSSGTERQLYRTTLVGQPLLGLDGSESESVEGEPMLSCEEELSSQMHAGRTGTSFTGNGFKSAFPEPS
ncbi:MAG: alpha-ketoglutarate-dependent taurine dioxygenase [Limisphaerales bacterium]|jgi:alpha-ketoglutarate-dependent taurine dioxygenase